MEPGSPTCGPGLSRVVTPGLRQLLKRGVCFGVHIQRTLKEFVPSSCAAGSWREEKKKENSSRVEVMAQWLQALFGRPSRGLDSLPGAPLPVPGAPVYFSGLVGQQARMCTDIHVGKISMHIK